MAVQTIYEVAAELRCSPRKISTVARQIGVGANLRGRAGWRFTSADKAAIWESMRPPPPSPVSRRRKRRRGRVSNA